jgi:DNA-binding NarL/FixJ family response regulator
LFSEVLGLELHIISGELRFRVPETGEFVKTHKEENLGRLAEEQARLAAESAFQQSEQARLAAESTLRSLVTQLLNCGMSLEQVAQMMNLSTVEVRRLVGEKF